MLPVDVKPVDYDKKIVDEIMDAYSYRDIGKIDRSRTLLRKLQGYDLPILLDGDREAITRLQNAIKKLEKDLSDSKK